MWMEKERRVGIRKKRVGLVKKKKKKTIKKGGGSSNKQTMESEAALQLFSTPQIKSERKRERKKENSRKSVRWSAVPVAPK